MSDPGVSDSGLTDSVSVELAPAEEALEELVHPKKIWAQLPKEAVVEDLPQQRDVVNFEDGWTTQSSHGVLLDHFVPSQDYKAIEADPAERIDVADDQDW